MMDFEHDSNRRPLVIAVDFDGCLCTNEWPGIGKPNQEVIAEAKRVREEGACLVLWTFRQGAELEEAIEACRSWGLEFDAVNRNPKIIIDRWGDDSRKIAADEYWRSWGPTRDVTADPWSKVYDAIQKDIDRLLERRNSEIFSAGNEKVIRHKAICEELNQLYERKNHDYGDSFHQTFIEEGMAMPRIRLGDKLSRFKTLSSGQAQQVTDESMRDTLLDMANYAIMTILEMEDKDAER